jgi:hypothetical protein
VLWGEVPKQGDTLRFFLRGAGRQETQIMLFDKGLAKERPDGALGTVLAAVAVSQMEAGHYLDSRLRPVVARLQALLVEPRLVPTVERGNLYHALGMTLTAIGEQTGDNSIRTLGPTLSIIVSRSLLSSRCEESRAGLARYADGKPGPTYRKGVVATATPQADIA